MKGEDADEEDEMERSLKLKLRTMSTIQSSMQKDANVSSLVSFHFLTVMSLQILVSLLLTLIQCDKYCNITGHNNMNDY